MLTASRSGLAADEAARGLGVHGPNELPAAAGGRPFNAVLGHIVDAGVILAIVIVNAVVGFLQECRAEKVLNRFGRGFTVAALVAAALLFVFAVLLRGFAWDEALIAVVALAVGVVPEGLLAVMPAAPSARATKRRSSR